MFSVTRLLKSLRKNRTQSFSEILDEIDTNIKLLEEHKLTSISNAKKFKFHLFYYSSLFFGAILLLTYFIFRPSDITSKFFFGAFAFSCPLLVWLLKYAVNFVFLGNVQRSDKKLKELVNKKRKILMEVMDTQTYNRAQQILNRFDPHGKFQYEQHRVHNIDDLERTEEKGSSSVRKRNLSEQKSDRDVAPPSPKNKTSSNITTKLKKVDIITAPQPPSSASPVRHRPILPRERSIVDKLIDALVGDGPDRRYALICQRCASHNGMALAEEFEYLAFYCCYCGFLNPARKLRCNLHISKMDIPPVLDSTPISSMTRRSASAGDLPICVEETYKMDQKSFGGLSVLEEIQSQSSSLVRGEVSINSHSNNENISST